MNITMVPGTGKSVAAVALAQATRQHVNEEMRRLYRERRMAWAERGRLPSWSSFEHSVALGVYMVHTFPAMYPEDDNVFNLADEVKAILDRTTTGRHELWFSPEDGSAFISFEDHDDAVMFELALTGDRR